MLVESRILSFGICNPAQGIQNSANDYYLESGILLLIRIRNPSSRDKESGIRNPQGGIQNPRLSCVTLYGAKRKLCSCFMGTKLLSQN